MPNPINITNITPPRVPLIDSKTGLISREWYRFFLNLFQLTGNGTNQISLTDLQIGPPPLTVDSIPAPPNNVTPESNTAEVTASLNDVRQELQTLPDAGTAEVTANLNDVRQELQTLPPAVDCTASLNVVRQELETLPRNELGTMAALEQANVPWLTFNTAPSPVPTAVGSMYWDGGTTMNLQATSNVLIRIGESEFVYAKASSAITKGQLCYHTGAVGASGVITVAPTPLALADPNQIVGVAAETIALNGFGLIQISGDLRGFNTSGSSVGETWADGDPLYYNPAYVGSFTKTKPSAPNQKTFIGEVINAGPGSSGSINIRIVQGTIFGGTDSNVQFSALANGDLIQYDSALQYWKNVPASTLPVGTATNIGGGATGSVPYQSAASTTTFLPIGTANQVLKVNAGATAPTWVSGAALTKTDDTNVTLTLGGSPSTSLLAATSLTLGWTGQLATTRGGTGLSSFTANGVVYASSTSALATSSGLIFNGTNLGIGVSPSAWTTSNNLNVLDVSLTAAFGADNAATFVNRNGYYNGSNWVYKTNSYSNHFVANDSGQFVWYKAGPGTAGNTISYATAMTLDNSANLSITGAITSTRVNPRVSSTASTASITPDVSAYDQYCVTAQAATLTINAPIGTPVDGNKLIFRILDNGTPQTLSWNGTFTAIGVTLPTTTTASKMTYVGCIYNAANTRWDVIAVTTQA